MYVQTYNGCVYYHMAMVVVGYVQSFTVLCIRGRYQVLPWQPLRIEVVVGYTFDLLSEAISYLLRTFLTVAMVTFL